MREARPLSVSVPNFDQDHYLRQNEQAASAVRSGAAETALDHYVGNGLDEDCYLVGREILPIVGLVERLLVSKSGFCLLIGWAADEGYHGRTFKMAGAEFSVAFAPDAILRHGRADVRAHLKGGNYNYGFIAFGRCPSPSLLKQELSLQVDAGAGLFEAGVRPEIVSDKRLLDSLLELLALYQSRGIEPLLDRFLLGSGGDALRELFQLHVRNSSSNPYVERFRLKPVTHSLITVLFGTSDPIMFQPLLFRSQGVDVGEWVYVCNSPEDGDAVLRRARLISGLYDVMITVIVMPDNVGFSAANNLGIERAASGRIFMLNPDVFPLEGHAAGLARLLERETLGNNLWGGLLFYDTGNLMHSGMYLEQDAFVMAVPSGEGDASSPSHCTLLRTEHFDKGVPFEEQAWQTPKEVPAISGAVMAFGRAPFEKLGGFSTEYIYGHYEDADLSLRWREQMGQVLIHPDLRMIHLEGQGAKARGEQYRGASVANRYLFTADYLDVYEKERAKLGSAANRQRLSFGRAS